MFHRLWKDEAGAVISAEIVLVATILVIGMVVGLKSVRDSVVTELADVAQAIANIDQSYSYSGILGHAAQTTGSFFHDQADFCDVTNEAVHTDTLTNTNSKCVQVAEVASSSLTGGETGLRGFTP
jgi:Flp pilus assembly pilin Flp